MKLRIRSSKTIFVGCLLTTVFFALAAANAAGGINQTRDPVVSNLWIPFNQTASVTIGTSSELVDFTGSIHMVATVSFPNDPILPPSPIRIHTNMANVSGIGQTSGDTYQLAGAGNFAFPVSLPGSFTFGTSYRLLPSPPPIRDLSFSVGYIVSLNSDGQVTDVQAFPTIIEE